MSEERRLKQTQRQDAGFVKQVEKPKKTLLKISVGAIVGDFIKDSLKDKIREWVLLRLGDFGKWFIGNPFSIVTIFLVCVVLWLIYVAIREAVTSEPTGLVNPHSKQEIYRPSLNPRFAASFAVSALIIVAAVAYGSWRYYTTPFPAYIRVSSSWFDVHYKGADLWVTVNVQNFSDQVLDATGEMEATAFNQPILRDTNDPSAGDEDKGTKILPWKQSYQHVLFTFDPQFEQSV